MSSDAEKGHEARNPGARDDAAVRGCYIGGEILAMTENFAYPLVNGNVSYEEASQ